MFCPCFAFPSTAPAASTDRSGGHESLSKMQWSAPSCPRRPDRVPCFVVGKIELVALNDAFYPTYSRKRSKDGLIGIHRPASLFLPNGPTRLDVANRPNQPHDATPPSLVTDVIEPPAGSLSASAAVEVEVEVHVPPSGETEIRSGRRCSAPGIRNLWMFRVQRL